MFLQEETTSNRLTLNRTSNPIIATSYEQVTRGKRRRVKLLQGVDTLIADRRSHTQTNPIQRSCPSRLVHKLHINANYDSRRPFVWETDNDTLKTRRSRRSRQSRISPSCTRLLF